MSEGLVSMMMGREELWNLCELGPRGRSLGPEGPGLESDCVTLELGESSMKTS